MVPTDDEIHNLTEGVIGCAIEVHRTLGPGLLESVYRECLTLELAANGFGFERELCLPLMYKGQKVRNPLRIDLLVSGTLVVEVKAVEALHPIHKAQVITYLKLMGCPAGLLMNFNTTSLRSGLHRLDHPDRYIAKQRASGLWNDSFSS
jgi:GxxExxY protein